MLHTRTLKCTTLLVSACSQFFRLTAMMWPSNGISTLNVIKASKALCKSLAFFKQIIFPIVITIVLQ